MPIPRPCKFCRTGAVVENPHPTGELWCASCEATIYLAARALVRLDAVDIAAPLIENIVWERARPLVPLVARRFIERPDLFQRFDAVTRLGADVAGVRELAKELLPLPMPAPPRAA